MRMTWAQWCKSRSTIRPRKKREPGPKREKTQPRHFRIVDVSQAHIPQCGAVAIAMTKSEARAAVKKILRIDRLPVGTMIEDVTPPKEAA